MKHLLFTPVFITLKSGKNIIKDTVFMCVSVCVDLDDEPWSQMEALGQNHHHHHHDPCLNASKTQTKTWGFKVMRNLHYLTSILNLRRRFFCCTGFEKCLCHASFLFVLSVLPKWGMMRPFTVMFLHFQKPYLFFTL